MTTPNPLVPQGSLLEEKAKSKTSLPVAFFIFLALHAVVLGGILMVGCKKEEETPKARTLPPLTNELPPLETNALYTPPPVATNVVVPPPITPPSNLGGRPGSDLNPGQPQPNSGGLQSGAGGTPGGTGDAGAASVGGDYKIAKGDTFATIAKRHGTTIQKIAKANPGVHSNRLKVGQILVIPGAAPSSGSSPAAPGSGIGHSESASSEVYTVKSGDNLTRIAKAMGTTPKAVRAANNMKTDRITVGQKLKVPVKGAAGAASAPAEGAPNPAPPVTPAGGPVPPRN